MIRPVTTFDDIRQIAYLSSGQVLEGVHRIDDCTGRFCPIHNPSNHPYKNHILAFSRGYMIRLSDKFEHGLVIDPDDYLMSIMGKAIIRSSKFCIACQQDVKAPNRGTSDTCRCGNVRVSEDGFDSIASARDGIESCIDTSIVFFSENYQKS